MNCHPYDLIIGLDRSDAKADLCLIDTHSGQRSRALIDTSPETLWEWCNVARYFVGGVAF